jgi:hypothetical protein
VLLQRQPLYVLIALELLLTKLEAATMFLNDFEYIATAWGLVSLSAWSSGHFYCPVGSDFALEILLLLLLLLRHVTTNEAYVAFIFMVYHMWTGIA